jgi:Tfp pilus assembly protein PilV
MLGRRWQRRVAAEDGLTLPELLIASVLGLVVVGAAVTIFASGVANQPRIGERTAEIQQARTMSERLARELRQGSNASSATPGVLSILTYVPHVSCGSAAVGAAIRCRVFYSCNASGTCVRTECPPNLTSIGVGCGPTTTTVTGLADNNVFSFTPRTPGEAYVSIRLAFPATGGEDAITVQDGVALRNPPLGAS